MAGRLTTNQRLRFLSVWTLLLVNNVERLWLRGCLLFFLRLLIAIVITVTVTVTVVLWRASRSAIIRVTVAITVAVGVFRFFVLSINESRGFGNQLLGFPSLLFNNIRRFFQHQTGNQTRMLQLMSHILLPHLLVVLQRDASDRCARSCTDM